MNCDEYKKLWIYGDITKLGDRYEEALDHGDECTSCRDESMKKDLVDNKVDISLYPCVHMAYYAEYPCQDHPDSSKCPDAVISYNEVYDEYAIKHPDGIALIQISNCPWCGITLPSSMRDEWFDRLEELGFDDPSNQNIPAEFESRLWRMNS